MTETAESSLQLLQVTVQRVLDSNARIETSQREIMQRLSRLEKLTAGLHQDWAQQSARMDNFSDRLTRIEERIRMIDGPSQ